MSMSGTRGVLLEKIRARPWVEFVDDERDLGNGIIVTLQEEFYFLADPGCGVRGFDTATEAYHGTAITEVRSP